MAYRLIIGSREHISDDAANHFEPYGPELGKLTEPGPVPKELIPYLPKKIIITKGSDRTEISIAGMHFLDCSDQVRSTLAPIDPSIEFFQLELVDLPASRSDRRWLMRTPHHVRMINSNQSQDALQVVPPTWMVANGKRIQTVEYMRVAHFDRLVLDKSAIQHLHFWTGVLDEGLTAYWFCSQEFRDAMFPFRRSFGFQAIREA
ncbi:MAG: hypothetical protein ACKVP7_19320 [Hyphomicrobiaceae bacterium]